MKVQVLANLAKYEEELDDRYKVFAALLTFLHKKYPRDDYFRLHARDIKIVLDSFMMAAVPVTMNETPIRIGNATTEHSFCSIHDAKKWVSKETIEWEITDRCASATWMYLYTLMTSKFDWEDQMSSGIEEKTRYEDRRKHFRFTYHEAKNLFSCRNDGVTEHT